MKSVKEMTQIELAAFVQSHLRGEGIQVTLSGGAAVSLIIAAINMSRMILI